MKKFLAAVAALAMATVPTMAVNAAITNTHESYDFYCADVNQVLPAGRTLDEVKAVAVRLSMSSYNPEKGANGGFIIQSGVTNWEAGKKKWGNASCEDEDYSFPDDGSDFTVVRPIEDDILTNNGGWAQICIQHWWGDGDVTVEEVYFLDADNNRLEAKAEAPAETTPSETEATTPAPSETEATTASSAAATTAAATTKAAAATTKANPTTGESNTGVALAVTAAMAAAGVAVAFGKKKK